MKLSERIISRIPDYLTADNVVRETEGVTTPRNTVTFQVENLTISIEENRDIKYYGRYVLNADRNKTWFALNRLGPVKYADFQKLCNSIKKLIVEQVRRNER